MTTDRSLRRHEIAVRARAYLQGLVPRSTVLEGLEACDWEDPLLRPTAETASAKLRVRPPKLYLIPDGFPRLFVVGRGLYEDGCIPETLEMGGALRSKGIRHSLDDWGPMGGHDWPYWKHQMREYLGYW